MAVRPAAETPPRDALPVLPVACVLSDAPERLSGGQTCGADGGQQPGKGADDDDDGDGGGQAVGPGVGDDDGPALMGVYVS
jgi:hypothetical protein